MVCREFPDNSERLFGREPELAYLFRRCELRGLTAVVGRPQMGKSSLLAELARQRSQSVRHARSPEAVLNLSAQPSYLVGFAEAGVENPDQMLRVVADLYCRWLSDSRYWEQAQVLYARHKEDLVGKTGEAVGSIFKELSKLGSKPLEVVGSLVKETFDALASANRDLKDGGQKTPRLQIEQSRELLTLLYSITHCQLILIFDQWDKSPNLEMESNILDAFLHHLDEWPPCHMVLGVRSDEKPRAILRQLQKGFEGAMDIFPLPPMHLEEASGSTLLQYVRSRVRAASEASDADRLEMIAGYPGVVSKWTASYNQKRIDSVSQLEATALEAQNYRYDEFETILPKLSNKTRKVSMRLALMPACASTDGWMALRQIALDGGKGKDLDTLQSMDVLEAASPPTYGHATRLEAARRWFVKNCTVEFGEVCEELIFRLGGEIPDVAPRSLPFASSLSELEPICARLGTSAVARAVCIAALALFGDFDFDSRSLIGVTSAVDQSHSKVTALLGIGLFNSLTAASDVGALEQRDALLHELRALGSAFSQNPTTRDWLARGLFNTIVDAKQEGMLERRDALLDELRTLASSFPQDPAVRLWLANGLLNKIIDANQEGTLEPRDAMLEALRTLASSFPEDTAVHGKLAQGLLNTLTYAKQENALERRDALLGELRKLANTFPRDSEVREQLAMGLFNTLNPTRLDESAERREALLEELRMLANSFPEDAAVRRRLAKGLLNVQTLVKGAGALERRNTLLEELRPLTCTFPHDVAVRQLLAMGLFNVLNDAMHGQARRKALLEELRTLADSFPEDAAIRESLAKSLSNMIYYAKNDGALEQGDAFLNELRTLAKSFPNDDAVHTITRLSADI
jgi:hypothetical protein